MYVEVFIIDNFLMNYIIVRIASALTSVKPAPVRTTIICFILSVFAAFSYVYPTLTSLPWKIALGAIMALSFSPKTIALYANMLLCIFVSAVMAGGLAYCILLSVGALTLRTALFSVVASMTIPMIIRRINAKRAKSGEILSVEVIHDGKTHKYSGIVDSGNFLTDPVTALPVIVVPMKKTSKFAYIPIPCSTVTGSGMLYAFIPDEVRVDGITVSAMVATSDLLSIAIVPPTAIPVNGTGSDVMSA